MILTRFEKAVFCFQKDGCLIIESCHGGKIGLFKRRRQSVARVRSRASKTEL